MIMITIIMMIMMITLMMINVLAIMIKVRILMKTLPTSNQMSSYHDHDHDDYAYDDKCISNYDQGEYLDENPSWSWWYDDHKVFKNKNQLVDSSW